MTGMIDQFFQLFTPTQRSKAVILLFSMLCAAVLEAAGIGLVVPVITMLIRGDMSGGFPQIDAILMTIAHDRDQVLTIVLLLMVLFFLFKTAFLGWLAYFQAHFAFGLQASLSETLFRGYLSQPYLFHLQRNSAQLIRNALNETNQFTFGAVLPLLVLLTEVLVITFIFAILLAYEPTGTLFIVLIGASIGGLLTWFTREKLRRWGELRQHHESARIQHLQQGLMTAKEVMLRGCEQHFFRRYAHHNAVGAWTGERQTAIQAVPRLLLELFAILTLVIVVLLAREKGLATESLLPVFGLFSVAAFRLIPSANRILVAMQSLRFSLPVLQLLVRELNACRLTEHMRKQEAIQFEKNIVLRQVSFKFPGSSAKILDGANVEISFGTAIGFVGESGAGKSTLINILLGLLTPSEGEMLIDGRDYREVLRSWQKQIGYVPQHVQLLDDSLLRNIAFGEDDGRINDADLKYAVTAAQLGSLIESIPDGLDTVVGERGARLSGGQMQRVGIARALYHRPKVLILDEATSALDQETEREIMGAVYALKGKMTMIIVAHRLTTLSYCDVIYRMEDGRLARALDVENTYNGSDDRRQKGAP